MRLFGRKALDSIDLSQHSHKNVEDPRGSQSGGRCYSPYSNRANKLPNWWEQSKLVKWLSLATSWTRREDSYGLLVKFSDLYSSHTKTRREDLFFSYSLPDWPSTEPATCRPPSSGEQMRLLFDVKQGYRLDSIEWLDSSRQNVPSRHTVCRWY